MVTGLDKLNVVHRLSILIGKLAYSYLFRIKKRTLSARKLSFNSFMSVEASMETRNEELLIFLPLSLLEHPKLRKAWPTVLKYYNTITI